MLRWLLIGVGDIASRRVIPAIREEHRSRLAAIVTRDSTKATPYGVPAFNTLDEAVSWGGFDAVYVATPVFLHGPQTIAALRAGFHVLCEKPMAMTFRQAQNMVEAAQQHRRRLGVAYYRRAYPKVRRAMELIRQGAIGQPVMAFASSYTWLSANPTKRAWLLDPAQAGGGPLYDVGSHRIDLLNHFFGLPQEVRACLSNAVHKSAVEDAATVLVKYAKGVHGIIDVRWNSHIARDEFRIIGTEGEIDLTPLNGPGLVWPSGHEELPPHSNFHHPCVKNFTDAVLDGEPLLSSGATALWTDWVIDRAAGGGKSESCAAQPSVKAPE
jgi:1,5-anhydro-D-fructose reductase (1,5-anhydro-D-mannitol-forming)